MKRHAFTLVEILVTVIIISVLSAIALTGFNKAVETNKDSICQQNINLLAAAIDAYILENDALPASFAAMDKYYGYNYRLLKCPADKAADYTDNSYTSYDFNPNNLTKADLDDDDKSALALICDKTAFHKVYNSSLQMGNSENKFQDAINQYGDIGNIDPNNPQKAIGRWTGKKTIAECPDFSAGSANCCVTRDAWKSMLKKCRDKCTDAGYQHSEPPCI